MLADRHARPERGIQFAGAIIPSLPSAAFRQPRIIAPEFAGTDSPVEACCSKRPFAHQRRAYPLRHSHSRVDAPGLFLRGNAPFSPKPLTPDSLPRRLLLAAGKINAENPHSGSSGTLTTAHRSFTPHPGLSARPARSARSGSPP
jgi:hypothetical protein